MNSGGIVLDRLITVDSGEEFSGDFPVNIGFQALGVSVLWSGILCEVETFLGKEFALLTSGLMPHLCEPRVTSVPDVKLSVRRELGMIAEKAKEGFLACAEKFEETLGELFCEALLGAFRPLWGVLDLATEGITLIHNGI